MNFGGNLDTAAKTLTIASTALYLLGYIDAGAFLSAVAAAAALMSTLLIHRMGRTLKKLARGETIIHRLQGASKTSCTVCRHPQREAIDSLLQAGENLDNVLEKFPEVSRRSLAAHRRHLQPAEKPAENTVEELEDLLTKLKNLYDQLETLTTQLEEMPTREFLASVNTRLDIIARMKDILITLEKLRPSSESQDLSTLLQQLVEEKT
ncbi:MAG: hypothetical protein NZ941_02540 [Candidatus Caldarchaeum sp.]|nr:hypothetical protein [Candidatus Caldarchaeum sp.]